MAVAVKDSGLFSRTPRSPTASNTGATFTSFTVMATTSESVRDGTPLSVTITVTLYTPGPSASSVGQVNRPLLELIEHDDDLLSRPEHAGPTQGGNRLDEPSIIGQTGATAAQCVEQQGFGVGGSGFEVNDNHVLAKRRQHAGSYH